MYLQENKSTHDIAKHFGVSVSTICEHFRKNGIKIKEHKVTIRKESLEKCVNEGKSARIIATEPGVTVHVVYKRLKEHGIAPKGHRIDIPVKTLEQKYHIEKKTAQQIALELGCSKRLVLSNLHRAGIPIRVPNNVRKIKISKDDLIKLYQIEGLTTTDIGKKFGCYRGTIARLLKTYDIPRRPSGTTSRTRISEKTLRRMHLDERKSTTEIARELKCSEVTIWKKQQKCNIEIRGRNPGKIITKDILQCIVDEGITVEEIAEQFKCNKSTIYTYLKKFDMPRQHNYSNPDYASRKLLRKKSEMKFIELKKFLGGSCTVCKRNSQLVIHHMYYLPDDVIHKKYDSKPYLYHIDLEPLVRAEPQRFRLLCKECHQMIGLFHKFNGESRERMFDKIDSMINMRKTHPTKHSELVVAKK